MPYSQYAQQDPQPLRIGYSTAHPLGGKVDPECVEAVQKAAKLFESLGHHVEEVPLPWDGMALARAYLMMYFGETGATLAGLQDILGRRVRPSDIEPITWLLGQPGKSYSAADFAAARNSWNIHARAMGQYFQGHNLLLMPTLASVPMKIGELQPTGTNAALLSTMQHINLAPLLRRTSLVDELAITTLEKTPFTQMANLTGLSAMSLPLHWSAQGLPVGVQLVAPLAREDLLFQLAGQIERTQPWFGKRPRL